MKNNSLGGAYFRWGAVLDNVHNWTFTGNVSPVPSADSHDLPVRQRYDTIASARLRQDHIYGSSTVQSTCSSLLAGETLHNVLYLD